VAPEAGGALVVLAAAIGAAVSAAVCFLLALVSEMPGWDLR